MNQDTITELMLGELAFMYHDPQDGGFIIGALAPLAELLNLPEISDEKKLGLIAILQKEQIVGVELHWLRVDICKGDMSLFAKYVEDGTAKSLIKALAHYEDRTQKPSAE